MSKVRRLILALVGLALFLPFSSAAEPSTVSTILITEVQTGSAVSASEEFIELYNAAEQAIDVSDWQVQYFSAAATDFKSPTRTIHLSGLMLPGKYYLIASNDYLVDQANTHYSATLAKTGGHLRLVSPDPAVETAEIERDLLGWGTASFPESTAAPAPEAGQSLARKLDLAGFYVDSDNNSDDFEISNEPSPEGNPTEEPPIPQPSEEEPADPQPEEENPPSQIDTESTAANNSNQIVPKDLIQITELLPNPAPPATDADDEFVELYNPNDEIVDISGYKLQTGNSFSHS